MPSNKLKVAPSQKRLGTTGLHTCTPSNEHINNITSTDYRASEKARLQPLSFVHYLKTSKQQNKSQIFTEKDSI